MRLATSEKQTIAPAFWNCFKALARTLHRGIQPPKMAAPGRIDVWRLEGFPEVSSSEIVGLPSPGIAPPLLLALQNKETHVIKFLSGTN